MYHPGFSNMFLRITLGVTVPLYPRPGHGEWYLLVSRSRFSDYTYIMNEVMICLPMKDLRTLFLEAILLSLFSASVSERPAGKGRSLGNRIDFGTVDVTSCCHGYEERRT